METIEANSLQIRNRVQPDLFQKQVVVDLSQRFSVVSLFSGCGGMDLGFLGDFTVFGRLYEKLPFEIVWANELNPAACRSYRRNIDDKIVEGDIWENLDKLPSTADVVIGGFPCQDISINGKGLGINGKRSGQYRAMVEAVKRLKPSVFVAENVKGLLLRSRRESLRTIIDDFAALGYNVSIELVNAADFGVPQTRERVFIIGVQKDKGTFSPPEVERDESSWMSARSAIGDLAELEPDESINHIWSQASVSSDQGNRKLVADRPGYTIRAECHGNIQFHYELPRRISMREAARLQSFPDSFVFESKLRETERQVGNAVPPVLAWHIGRAIAALLSKPYNGRQRI